MQWDMQARGTAPKLVGTTTELRRRSGDPSRKYSNRAEPAIPRQKYPSPCLLTIALKWAGVTIKWEAGLAFSPITNGYTWWVRTAVSHPRLPRRRGLCRKRRPDQDLTRIERAP